MVKLRSRKSEEKCLPLTPTAVTTPTSANAYESLRLARIAENQARMAALGVQKHAGDLKSMFKVTKSAGGENSSPSRRKWVRRSLSSTPIRRSQRLKERPPSTPFSLLLRRSGRLANHSSSSDGKNKVLFGSEDEKSFKRSKNVCRSSREDNEELRPANAPLPPPCSPAELQLSEDKLARRCNSKTRGSIYDPILGICCHFCRQKKLCGEEGCERCGNRDGAKACIGKTDCSVCHSSTGVFCRACLKVRYGEDIEEVRQNKNWMCPHCSEEKGINPYWICNSSLCLKKRKIPPTGIAIYTAREMGYKSVAHYLVDILKKRGFSG